MAPRKALGQRPMTDVERKRKQIAKRWEYINLMLPEAWEERDCLLILNSPKRFPSDSAMYFFAWRQYGVLKGYLKDEYSVPDLPQAREAREVKP